MQKKEHFIAKHLGLSLCFIDFIFFPKEFLKEDSNKLNQNSKSQWRNHGEGAKPPLAKSFKRFNPKIQAFKHVLDLT